MSKTPEKFGGLHVLVHASAGPEHGTTTPQLAATIAKSGADVIQLREKSLRNGDLVSLSSQIRRAMPRDKILIINDNVTVAREIAAAENGPVGVHLGQEDLAAHPNIREELGELPLGISIASVGDARKTVAFNPRYFGIGPFYHTANKSDAGPPIGLRRLEEVAAAFPEKPIIAVGGITPERAQTVMRFGASGFGVIGAVLSEKDYEKATRTLSGIVTPGEQVPLFDGSHDSGWAFGQEIVDNCVARSRSRSDVVENNGALAAVSVLLFSGHGEDRNVLLQHRAKHKRWGDTWEGSMAETVQMRPDDPLNPESPLETALRGISEELRNNRLRNRIVKKDLLKHPSHYLFTDMDAENNPTTTSILTVYGVDLPRRFARSLRFQPDPDEVQSFGWFPVTTLLENAFTDVPRDSINLAPGFKDFVVAHPVFFKG